ncbi:MAG: hypothetical protein K2X47_13620, partial [Bdellovibrionales bacterium]|nr:hypothetical protein [Bdellovibrionales bacterium]
NLGRRKEMRPLDRRKTIHVTMRAEKARGPLSFRTSRNFAFIASLVKEKSAKFGVRVQSWANVGNHLHLEVRMRSRKEFGQFLKSMTGGVARFVTGARRGKKFGKFWDGLVHTRVLTSRNEELRLSRYILLNQVEGEYGTGARAILRAAMKEEPGGHPYRESVSRKNSLRSVRGD